MDWQKHFADRSRESASFGNLGQAEDIDAINRYIVYTETTSPAALKIRDEWIRWHDQLGWWELNMDAETYDRARNRRNEFNLANAKDAADRAYIRQLQQTGLSTEEMQGGTRRVLSSGTYETPDVPLIPSSFKAGVAVTLATAALGYIAFKFYSPASLLRLARR